MKLRLALAAALATFALSAPAHATLQICDKTPDLQHAPVSVRNAKPQHSFAFNGVLTKGYRLNKTMAYQADSQGTPSHWQANFVDCVEAEIFPDSGMARVEIYYTGETFDGGATWSIITKPNLRAFYGRAANGALIVREVVRGDNDRLWWGGEALDH